MFAGNTAPLLRYWLFPGRLRRLHIAVRIALALGIVLLTATLAVVTLRQKPATFSNSPLMIAAVLLFVAMPSLLVILGTFAGATLIAGERQRQTWEALLLTTTTVRRVVALKFVACLIFCVLLSAPCTVWLTVLLYKAIRSQGFFSLSGGRTPHIVAMRTGVFLTWNYLHVTAHIIPAVAFGTAVSARSRRVNDALLVSTAALAAYVIGIWQLYSTLHVTSILNSSDPGLALELIRWPVLPYLSGEYGSSDAIMPQGWPNNIAADLIWILLIPALLQIPTLYWSRLHQRRSKRRSAPSS